MVKIKPAELKPGDLVRVRIKAVVGDHKIIRLLINGKVPPIE